MSGDLITLNGYEQITCPSDQNNKAVKMTRKTASRVVVFAIPLS